MRLMAFPTEAVSVVPANVSIDHALAGLGDRYEHHFLAAVGQRGKIGGTQLEDTPTAGMSAHP